MFKKLVVGALATGIMLSSAGGAMAATPNTESPKQEKVTMAPLKPGDIKSGYPSRNSIPNVVVENGIKWYLKDAWKEPNGTWSGYFEGWIN
ncbi:lysine 2,3-aminomutase [Bacillus wiedmannii]|uniref:LCI fold-containing protein n=1 Tax=Bacillus wiedmannii TaxID=1890302 RepID=UPI000BFD40BD|nr:LCI fold-containing protein [Bacillus wiedmannii]PHE94727.1 lysine 2,3-aminomutase [Bacillus wiedmannii]